MRGLSAIAVACVTTGSVRCTPSSHDLPARPSLLSSSAPLDEPTSPGRWHYHPREPAKLARHYELPEGALFVGDFGERWLEESGARRAVPASSLAPEALVGALRTGDRWAFVGRSGTAYDAESPLGPLLSARAPLERMARVDAGGAALLAASHTGRLLLSEDAGGSWREVGPSGQRFSDVLCVPPHALALAVPEKLWWSSDEGVSWQAMEAPAVGAEALRRDASGGAVVVAALGVHPVSFDPGARLGSPRGDFERNQPQLGAPPREGPSARALASGRAFVTEGRYFEVELGLRAEVLSGDFAGPLERRPLSALSACQELRVAGFGTWVYAACTRERAGPTRSFEFFRSEDGGTSFVREPYTARGSAEQVRLAAGADGALIVTGLCLPHESLAGCRPRGIQERRSGAGDAGTRMELRAVPTPALEEHAQALAFSADGHTAYAVGQRTKGDDLYIFVARDLETGFDAKPLPALEEGDLSGTARVHSLAAAADGQVSLVLGLPSGPEQLVLMDESGRTLGRNTAPVSTAAMGAYGGRAIAVSFEQGWESLDGGAQWESIGKLPRSVCSNARGRCSVSVVCHAGGCALGDSLSRVGWRGQARDTVPLLAPSWRGEATRRAVGKPFACELSDSEWRPLRGVDRMPDAAQAALGKSAWYALATDDATAGAGLWIADSDRGAAQSASPVRFSELLGPTERAADTAYLPTLQVEGAAAIRYSVPGTAGAAQARVTDIEVAWENLIEGRRERGRIADAGPYVPGDVARGEGAARKAQADLVSITSGGIYVRVHRHPQQDQPTYFLDGSRVTEIPPLRWSPPARKGSSSEMARVHERDLPLLLLNQGATVVRASLHGKEWRFDAMSVGFADPEDFAWRQHEDIAYAGGRPGIHVSLLAPMTRNPGQIFPLQAEGPVFGSPIAVPTQIHLDDPPRACSSEQRSGTPRVVAPHQPGARRPVLVHDPVEPLRTFLTDLAVLHGTPDAPCAEAFDAEPVRTSATPATSRERVLVSLRGPSWLFRLSADTNRRDARVEYRRMTCRFDPELEVPAEIYDMPGTRVEASSPPKEAGAATR